MLQAFAAAAAQGARATEVRDQTDRFSDRPDVLRTDRREMTTTDLVACETRLIAAATGRALDGTAVVDQRMVDRVLEASTRRPTDEQAAVVRAVTGDGRGVEVVEALAGIAMAARALRAAVPEAAITTLSISYMERMLRAIDASP